jgi:hypothetical protein
MPGLLKEEIRTMPNATYVLRPAQEQAAVLTVQEQNAALIRQEQDAVLPEPLARHWKARLMPGMVLRVALIVLLVGLGALADLHLTPNTPSSPTSVTADR